MAKRLAWDTSPVAGALLSNNGDPPTLPGAWYDHQAAEDAVNFFPWWCRFTAGSGKRAGKISAHTGKPFVLQPWQAWVVRQVFGWKRPDGTRVYRRVFIWVPRGNGKTDWAAGIGLLGLTQLGMPGGEVYSMATSQSQSKLVFSAASSMVSMSAELTEAIESFANSLYCGADHTVFKPLSGKPHGKHGLKCSLLIGDEAHEWRDAELHQYVRQSMLKWGESLEWIISTAGKPEGYGFELWQECQQICDGSLDDDETLVVIYAANDNDDPFDPAVHRRVNPNFGISVDPDAFAQEAKKAQQLPRRLSYFKRYNLNLWAGDTARWLPADAWAECLGGGSSDGWRDLAERLQGRTCYGGLDLASTRDTNAWVLIFPPSGGDPYWHIVPRFWWPRVSAFEQQATLRVPLEKWEADGSISLTPGNSADHDAILEQVFEDHRRFDIQSVGIDRMFGYQMMQDMMANGVNVIQVDQRTMTLSEPAKKLERLVLRREADHGGHPVLKWQAGGAAVLTDSNGNIRPLKKSSSSKIDGIAATVNALAVHEADAAKPKSYLETSPMLVLNYGGRG